MGPSIFEIKPAFHKVCRQAVAGLRDDRDRRFLEKLPEIAEELAVLAWEPGPLNLDTEVEVYTAISIILDGSSRITEALEYQPFSSCLEEEIGKPLPDIQDIPEWVRRVIAAAYTDAIEGPIFRHKVVIRRLRSQKGLSQPPDVGGNQQ